MNIMKEIRIEKITLNIGTGEGGNRLQKATKLLQSLTGQTPIEAKAKRRIPTWGVRPGAIIGTKVTVRKNMEDIISRMLAAVGNKLTMSKIGEGTFSFGIPEYIEIPGARYDAEIGIIGLGVMVTLKRPGFRIKNRSIMKRKIPKKHLISQEETIKFLQEKFKTKITD
ncbi:50S ribosomal protein L5 [Candidatus Woesearchaeota archaeon]|nr:50S ribosomal protein L5 [Candidatus Woesearchaeota archaeon]